MNMLSIKKSVKVGPILAFFLSLAVCSPVWSADFDAEQLQILSRLQAMSQGTYSDAEWNDVVHQLDTILESARANGQWNRFVETQVIRSKAMMMRGDDVQALNLMQQTLKDFGKKDVPSMTKVYVETASIYAHQGNEQGIKELIRQFRASRHYDGETYSIKGGSGPGDPVIMTRPKASADESISVTAMEVYQTQARQSRGQVFPDFNVVSFDGKSITLDELQGQVVLIDFWMEGWHWWKQDLPYRQSIYKRLHDQGFEIVGMCISPDIEMSKSFASAQKIRWPLATPNRDLLRTLGIFGESTNFLLDRHGIMIGRDLYGADLDAAVKAALKR